MAQIVTITNPLTGQPAQVDQLEHTAQEIDDAIARALPGGEIDITLANKAPAGYGLGGDAKFITSGDLNDYKNCGWYAWDEGVSHAPFDYGSCIILNKGGSWIVHQIAIAGYGQNICIRRYLTPTDTWDAWEWVNPPMQPGVEYRTTERYMGKPVYVKLVDCGLVVNGKKQVTHGIANCDYVIRYMGCVDKDAMPILLNKSWDDKWITYFGKVTNTTIEIYGGSSSAGKQVYCTMWYTKTTD